MRLFKNFLLMLVLFSACDKADKVTYFDLKTVKRITNLSIFEPPPPVFSFTPVFIPAKNDSTVMTGLPNLRQVYSSFYSKSYPNFTNFLFSALNQNVKLNTSNLSVRLFCDQIFKLDPAISTLYEKENIDGLIKRYVLPNKDGYTLRKDRMSLNEINSVSYYFFINQFIRQDDDYNASIHFRKLSTTLGDMGKN